MRGDHWAQPGFLGNSYKPGGVLFLGKNPGKNKEATSATDKSQFASFQELADACLDDELIKFTILCEHVRIAMNSWGLVRKYVLPAITPAGLNLNHIAYLNLLKWRCEETKPSDFSYAWEAHTKQQFFLLKPSLVVALGIGTGEQLQRLLNNDWGVLPEIISLKRSRNDAQVPPIETQKKFPEIAKLVEKYSS